MHMSSKLYYNVGLKFVDQVPPDAAAEYMVLKDPSNKGPVKQLRINESINACAPSPIQSQGPARHQGDHPRNIVKSKVAVQENRMRGMGQVRIHRKLLCGR